MTDGGIAGPKIAVLRCAVAGIGGGCAAIGNVDIDGLVGMDSSVSSAAGRTVAVSTGKTVGCIQVFGMAAAGQSGRIAAVTAVTGKCSGVPGNRLIDRWCTAGDRLGRTVAVDGVTAAVPCCTEVVGIAGMRTGGIRSTGT